jgi:hypothetical protein
MTCVKSRKPCRTSKKLPGGKKKEMASVETKPVQASLREAKTTTSPGLKTAEAKKVEKTKAKQVIEKPATSPNERPRIAVENEKRVASATVKSF